MARTLPRAALALLTVLALAVLGLSGCGRSPSSSESPTPTTSASGTSVTIKGNDALSWGTGDYGVVLAHGAAFDAASWEKQAVAIAEQGATVIAVEDIAPDAIGDAVDYLRSKDIRDVALVGGSAGADAILTLASQEPDLPDQLVLLSPNGTVEGLGEEPKLFIASKDESGAQVSTELAESARASTTRCSCSRARRTHRTSSTPPSPVRRSTRSWRDCGSSPPADALARPCGGVARSRGSAQVGGERARCSRQQRDGALHQRLAHPGGRP